MMFFQPCSILGRSLAGALVLGACLGFSPAAQARDASRIAAICHMAAADAARRWNVPVDVLQSIALTETGRRADGAFQPWPWTVNMEGVGKWFDSKEAARQFVLDHQRRGARSFDLGCFQINHRWHGHAFSSIEQMFDPSAGADYAARFLSELHSELGDWSRAAGAYHSRTPELARKYRNRFDRIRQAMQSMDLPIRSAQSQPAPLAVAAPVERLNSYPLLRRAEGNTTPGSLVPLPPGETTRPLVPAG